jgi:MFS family permease
VTAGRSLLVLREFRALLGARSTNALAVSALATVVAFQTYEITRDPLSLGWLGLVEAIPALSLVLFGGHLADRRDRRAIVIVASSVVTASAVALAILSAAGGISLIGILAVIFATGVASGFERPALTALEAQVVPRDEAVRGFSMLSSVSQTGSIVGPAIGGIAIAVVGIPATYAGIAALLAISTGCVALIGRRPIPEPIAGEPVLQSLLGGIRYVARSPVLLGSMALDLFAVFFGGAIALLPIFATDVLHVGAVGLGVLRTAPAAGALLVMLVATRRPPTRHAGATLLLSVAGFGLSVIVFGASTVFAVSLVALFLGGVTDGISVVIRLTILRVLSPERLRGRIAAVNWVFIGASNELGAFESGVAARLFGTVPSVIAGGVLTLAVVAATAGLAPSLRSLDLSTAGPAEDEPVEDGPAEAPA